MGYRPGPIFHEPESDELAVFEWFWSLLGMWLAGPGLLGLQLPEIAAEYVSVLLRTCVNFASIYMAIRCHLAHECRSA
jgi:hypothetical protein